ncbi:aldehyde dehydrogenase family protein [Echinicola sp. CAU 1574]|uniref:Aldehyde dehydrogenase n=1 Tax=Echinicola arenosa TaxID=2774144 RepID=A0ABR9AID7_9BACT|nr:aldehyde dehydrogenase family protein [Echinicola arenosa]MBD8488607.1 aldehyde dehydrogenase family protein [Echinicola arenosa]
MKSEFLTDNQRLTDIFNSQKQKAIQLRHSSFTERAERLKVLKEWIKENHEEIEKALYADLKKPSAETMVTETGYALVEINLAIKKLKKWMSPKKVKTPIHMLGTNSYIRTEPLGTALIISPWNYPFNLSIGPVVSAIAAGCTISLKPSELTPHTSALLRRMMTELFDADLVAVFEGGKETAQALLQLPFDHIFFTGSTSVGKTVMNAASRNLSSVTLELGGKSPVIIEKDYDLKDAAKKIAIGKFLNCGQTCISPDYLLIHESQKETFLKDLQSQINKMYNPKNKGFITNKDYGRIIEQKHLNRLQNLLADAQTKGGHIEFGGDIVKEENYMAPTIISNMSENMLLMQEEIFGPILPILTYHNIEEVSHLLQLKPKPLALYLFTKDEFVKDHFLKNTSSGTVVINDCSIQYMQNELPFGGVNHSGIGKSHGYAGFLAFSNQKSVVEQRKGKTLPQLLYPPYDLKTTGLINTFKKWLLKG